MPPKPNLGHKVPRSSDIHGGHQAIATKERAISLAVTQASAFFRPLRYCRAWRGAAGLWRTGRFEASPRSACDPTPRCAMAPSRLEQAPGASSWGCCRPRIR